MFGSLPKNLEFTDCCDRSSETALWCVELLDALPLRDASRLAAL